MHLFLIETSNKAINQEIPTIMLGITVLSGSQKYKKTSL